MRRVSLRAKLIAASLLLVGTTCLTVGGIGLLQVRKLGNSVSAEAGTGLRDEAWRVLQAGTTADRMRVENTVHAAEEECQRMAQAASLTGYLTALDGTNPVLRGIAEREVTRYVYGAVSVCETVQGSLGEKLKVNIGLATTILAHSGTPSLSSGEPREWVATNQITKESKSLRLAGFQIAGKALEPNEDAKVPSAVVDEVERISGARCTLFQRMNDEGDMLRVATTIQVDGKRVIGTEIAAEVGQMLGNITNSVGKAHALVEEIAASSGEQATGINQVNKAVGEMDKVTQSNAAAAEQSASAAQELSGQAVKLTSAVKELVSVVQGAAA